MCENFKLRLSNYNENVFGKILGNRYNFLKNFSEILRIFWWNLYCEKRAPKWWTYCYNFHGTVQCYKQMLHSTFSHLASLSRKALDTQYSSQRCYVTVFCYMYVPTHQSENLKIPMKLLLKHFILWTFIGPKEDTDIFWIINFQQQFGYDNLLADIRD